MDNLTHTLVGLMLARVGLGKRSAGATAAAMLASNIPDTDVITSLWGSAAYLDAHRDWTHGLPVMPLVALAPTFFVWPFFRARIRLPWVYLTSVIAVLFHVLLDFTNIYGIRLLAPFSQRWFRLDITSVIDPWIWLLLAVGTLWPLLSRMVSSEIGARSKSGPGAAWFALLAILGYNTARYFLHARAVETLESHMYLDAPPVRTAAFPSLANPLHWLGYTETREAVLLHDFRLHHPFDPDGARVLYKQAPSAAMEKAKQTEAFQALLRFSQFPYWRVMPVPEPEGAVEVEAVDLRFGGPGDGRFAANCIVDAAGRVIGPRFQFGQPRVGRPAR